MHGKWVFPTVAIPQMLAATPFEATGLGSLPTSVTDSPALVPHAETLPDGSSSKVGLRGIPPQH